MPYKDPEKQREAQRRSMRKARVSPVGENGQICETLDVKPEMPYEELKESLQWGIDTGRIQPRRRVAEYYGLTQKYGPARLEKHELLTLLNNDLSRKKIDSRLYYLGASSGNLADAFLYSNEW